VPHSLPGVAEMQQLIHDLPLRSADANRLRHSLYPDGSLPDGMYLRVLQVTSPEDRVSPTYARAFELKSRLRGQHCHGERELLLVLICSDDKF
jgi:hypothetical protein